MTHLFKSIHTVCFDTIDSTHSWGKKNFHTLDWANLTFITAAEQTAGYGRNKRKWLSSRDLDILATFCFTLPITFGFTANLGQILALAASALLEECGLCPEIKWPNDIRVGGRKIAGILCETFIPEISTNQKLAIVLSIGLNGNTPSALLEQIDQPATSLLQLTNHVWDLDTLRTTLLNTFIKHLEILISQGFAPFYEKYQQLLSFKGKKISYFDNKQLIEGICEGILPDGRLKLLLPNGEKLLLSSGEIACTQIP